MKVLIIEVPFVLPEKDKEAYKQHLKEVIKKDIEEDGIAVLFGGIRSYVADVDDIIVKMKEAEEEPEPVEEEIEGCRFSACRHYITYHEPGSLLNKMKCTCGHSLIFNEVCKDFEP